jgi:hypothetical protein
MDFVNLEEILKKYFGLKGNLCLTDGKYTKNGHIAYEKLIKLLIDLSNIIEIDIDNVIIQLDNIEYEN